MESRADQLTNLMTYTTFHIGVYIALAAGILGAGVYTSTSHWSVRWAVGWLVLAGFCGAMIASNIPFYATYEEFQQSKLGFWGTRIMPFECWATLERVAFWIGIVPAILIYLYWGAEGFVTRCHRCG